MKKTHTNNIGGVELTDSQVDAARKEGAKEAIKEGVKSAARTDTGTTADPEDAAEAERLRVAPDLESTFLAPMLDLPLDTLKTRMHNDKVEGFIAWEDVKGLLHLERSGKNRTDYVQAFCDRLGIDDPRKVTNAGPDYTNDVTAVSHL